MELAEVAIWISGASLVVSALNTAFNIRKSLSETAEKARSGEAQWRLDIGIGAPENVDPYRSVCITHQDNKGMSFVVRRVSLRQGWRFSLLGAVRMGSVDDPPGTLMPNPGQGSRRSLTASEIYIRNSADAENDLAYSEAWFFVEVPVRPRGITPRFTRLRVSVIIEDISANRRQSQIVLTSVQIPWASRRAERMT